MTALAGLVADALPGVAVDVGFLEMTDPSAGRVLDDLVVSGCRRLTVLPVVLQGAGHAKSDVPAVVLEARQRHPGVEILLGNPIGVSKAPIEVLGVSLERAGGAGLPLLVVARGTSDPDANAEAHKAARLIAGVDRRSLPPRRLQRGDHSARGRRRGGVLPLGLPPDRRGLVVSLPRQAHRAGASLAR